MARSFVINGQKIWTSFGAVSDYCYLICRTSQEGPPHAGISEVIVPMDTPGIEVRPIKDMTTNHHFCEVFFTDVRVPVENLVGVEGGAFKQTMRQLEHERGGIDRLVSNHALYLMALERADTSNLVVRDEIAKLEIGYRIGRILVIREVLKQAPAGFSAATKCFCTEHEIRVSDFVSRVLGPEATLWDDVTQGLTYAPGVHDHGRHVERDAQHPRRTGPRPPPLTSSVADYRRPHGRSALALIPNHRQWARRPAREPGHQRAQRGRRRHRDGRELQPLRRARHRRRSGLLRRLRRADRRRRSSRR